MATLTIAGEKPDADGLELLSGFVEMTKKALVKEARKPDKEDAG